ncbi:MAG: hypothetical protein JSV19_10235 [Phycisphaerales bacterium]|nr:MAG: hypothetical protein JSV19_10235 [Phycisphaerales bacterium]
MNEHTLSKLEFDHIRDALVAHCSSTLGKQVARRLAPSRQTRQVKRWLDQVREMTQVAQSADLPPMGGVQDVRAHIYDAGLPAGLEPEALARISETLAATGTLHRWFAQLPPDAAHIRALADRIGDFTPLAARINEVIDARGKVRDTASPKLASIRATIDQAKVRIKTVFDRLLRQARVQRLLQYSGATYHSDRLVLPLKAEHRGRVSGIIHRSSDSGATLFVEPVEAVELNNSIARLRYDEHDEITRILTAVSRAVHINAEEILRTLDALAILDLISAKVRYARKRQAVCPQIHEGRRLELPRARHPVLIDMFDRPADAPDEPPSVVPIDVRLGDDFDVLVITGPNTGGKTVALKTVGLLVLMTQAGIPIPAAAGATLPIYRDIFVDVGDEQSIEQSLSTYSAHMSNILGIIKRAGGNSLVLLDELGAGTDPDEGAAIGRAIMDELLRIRCSAILTTHLSALKGVAYTEPRVDNAAVEFDVESLRPTYRLRVGEPGVSNAITIADRLGMPARIVKQAKRHLARKSQALNEAIAGTLEIRRQAEAARTRAGQARIKAEQVQRECEQRSQELDAAKAAHRQWMQWVNGLRPGDPVYVKSFDKQGVVVRAQLHRQTVVVAAGSLDIEVPLTDLVPAETGE